MDIKEKLALLDSIKQKIDALGKLPEDVLKKINYRFRLDWNYYSNTMEGNTLTKDETRSIMIGNITVEGKPIKDVLEMRGHDETITKILKMGRGEMNVSEGRIKEIHKSIMNEEDPAKKPGVGQWKSVNNHIINYKNEKYNFTDSHLVHEEIHKLINWLGAENDKISGGKKDAIHPAILAFEFHLRYLSIHPFYDGNGRTARIFMNIILIAHGFPPVVITTEDKIRYYQLLADIQAYGGATDLYYEHMLDLLVRSLNLVYTAATGGDIEDPDELKKRIKLLGLEIDDLEKAQGADVIRTERTAKVIASFAETDFAPMVRAIIDGLKDLHRHFLKQSLTFMVSGRGKSTEALDNLDETIYGVWADAFQAGDVYDCSFQYGLLALRATGTRAKDVYVGVKIRFEQFKYVISFENIPAGSNIEKLYHQRITDFDKRKIVKMLGDYVVDEIERTVKQIKSK